MNKLQFFCFSWTSTSNLTTKNSFYGNMLMLKIVSNYDFPMKKWCLKLKYSKFEHSKEYDVPYQCTFKSVQKPCTRSIMCRYTTYTILLIYITIYVCMCSYMSLYIGVYKASVYVAAIQLQYNLVRRLSKIINIRRCICII